MKIGEKIEGKGIYIGQWQPKDRTGKSLGKTFALYAAPEDLTDETGKKLTATFRDTANRMTTLKNWHGHDGGDFTNDATIIQGLADGSAVGKWFIPTKELLVGTDRNGDKVQNDNLLAHKDKLGQITTFRDVPPFRGTYHDWDAESDPNYYWYPNYYWSSTEHRSLVVNSWCARLKDGFAKWDNRRDDCHSCRPVRVEVLVI